MPIGAPTRAEILTLTEVAEYMKTSKKTTYRMARSGSPRSRHAPSSRPRRTGA